jgi:phosphatidylinositol alpha-1,6-mannosyltransferase
MSKEVMNLCLVSQEYPPETGGGGIGTQTYLKAHGLSRRGHTVHVIASTYESLGHTERDGNVIVHRIPHPEGERFFSEPSVHAVVYSWLVAKKIYELREEVSFDLIEFAEYAAEGFIYQIDAYAHHEIPIVVMLHGSLAMFAARTGWPSPDSDYYRFATFMEDTTVQRADLLLAGSHNIARFWADRGHIPLERITVVHVAVDPSLFPSSQHKKADRPAILFVGRIDDEKGVFDVAEAVLQLRRKYPEILFRVVGTGDEEVVNLLQEKIAKSGAQHNFELVGYVPYTELGLYYAGCDVFASPAPNEHGVASVNLEAMSCAKPVVASTTGGAPEAVIDGQTGLLVPPGDLEALTMALDKLLADPELREKMGENGRKRVQEYFSLDQHMARVEALYRRLSTNPRTIGEREL